MYENISLIFTYKTVLKYHLSPILTFSNLGWCSVQLCLIFCNPMNRSMTGLPVHHQIPESTQTPVHCVGDAIQPFHPLLSPSSLALNFPSIRVFSNKSAFCIRWPKYWSFTSTSVPPMHIQDWSPLGWLVGSPCSPRDSQESSPTPQFKSINSLDISFLYSPTLTSIHDHWKNHSLD